MRVKRIGWKRWGAVVLMIVCGLVWTSCASSPEVPTAGIDWPAVPEPPEEGLEVDGEMVLVPVDYWLALVGYIVRVERIRETLNP